MADSMGTVLKVGLFGGAAFLAYKYFFAVPAATAPPANPPPGGGTTPPANPPPASFNDLAHLFDRLKGLVDAAKVDTATPDEFNVYYTQAGGPGPAPDPIQVFGNRAPMTLFTYWAGMSDWLATNKGLTGFGVYAGLGRLAYGVRR
jgi:hypothetical protein